MAKQKTIRAVGGGFGFYFGEAFMITAIVFWTQRKYPKPEDLNALGGIYLGTVAIDIAMWITLSNIFSPVA